jgi:hypothetical protein
MKRLRPNNPVAKALARARLQQTTTDVKIQLYLLEEGAPCADTCEIVGRILSVVADATAATKGFGPAAPEVRKLRGAASACAQMAESDAFQRINLVSIDGALAAVLELNKKLDPDLVLRMWAARAG